jgi:glutamyl-tRNA synthetase
LPAYTAYFFTEDFAIDAKVRDKVMGKGEPKLRLAELSELLTTADFSSDTAIEEAIKALAAAKGLGFGDYQSVARLAVSGTNVGPSLTGLFRVLGRERVLARFARLAAA